MSNITSDYIAMLAFASEETIEGWKENQGEIGQQRFEESAKRSIEEDFDEQQYGKSLGDFLGDLLGRPGTLIMRPDPASGELHGNTYWGGGKNKTHTNAARAPHSEYARYSQYSRYTRYARDASNPRTEHTKYSRTYNEYSRRSDVTRRDTVTDTTSPGSGAGNGDGTHVNSTSPTYRPSYTPTYTPSTTSASASSSSSSTSTSTSIIGNNIPELDGVGVNHTQKWEENRRKYNEAVDPDRSQNTFWAGEKFLLNATFTTEDNENYSDETLLAKVKIKGTSYETEDITTDDTQDGIIVQKAALWKEDMVRNLKNGWITFIFTFNDGSVREVDVKIDNDTDYYKLHMKQ